jgi:hypothetical protein
MMRNVNRRLLQAAGVAVVVAVVGSGATAVLAATGHDPRHIVVDDAEKQQLLDKELSIAAPSGQAKSDPGKLPVPYVGDADEPWPLGIFADGEAPFPAEEFTGTSNWVGTVGPQYVVLYAGADTETPTNGAAHVLYFAITDGSLVSAKTLAVPPGEGALTVASETAGSVGLVSADGTPHTFDPITGTLV